MIASVWKEWYPLLLFRIGKGGFSIMICTLRQSEDKISRRERVCFTALRFRIRVVVVHLSTSLLLRS